MTDPISDMLNRIKNAEAVKHPMVSLPFSNLKYEISQILEKYGFIEKVEKKGRKNKKTLDIVLKYQDGKPAITDFKRISKPGQRIYLGFKEIRKSKGGYGITIVSTSKGLKIDKEAKKQKLGGEIMVEVW